MSLRDSARLYGLPCSNDTVDKRGIVGVAVMFGYLPLRKGMETCSDTRDGGDAIDDMFERDNESFGDAPNREEVVDWLREE